MALLANLFCRSSQPVILYWFFLNVLSLAFRTFFRRIYIGNLERIPKGKPILLAPNHPNSFIDGILLSVLLRRKLNLLARGDVFKNPLANWALRSMRVLPIFRSEDGAGASQGSKNQLTFDQCHAIFRKKGMVLIFPEGYCVREWRLRPLKKGAAKMAFEAIEKYPDMDLQVVPVGLNYSNSGQFREEVCINFGHPIPISDYLPLLQKNHQAKATLQFNERLYEAMEREMVIIDQPANDLIGKHYLIMKRNQYKSSFFGFIKKSKHRFIVEKRAANDLNDLSKNNQEGFETFRNAITDYFSTLQNLNVKDKYFSLPLHEKILYFLFTLIFAIPAFLGFMTNCIPLTFARKMAKNKVRKIEFFDSVFIGVGAIAWLIYTLIILILCTLIFGAKGIAITIAIRLLGFVYYFWEEAALNVKYWMVMALSSKGKRMNKSLRNQRLIILNFFETKF